MTVVALICPDLVAGLDSPHDHARYSLDEVLLALFRGDVVECLVCGEPAELDVSGRAECASCGAVLEAPPREVDPGQLALL
jgi:hypothetical protein